MTGSNPTMAAGRQITEVASFDQIFLLKNFTILIHLHTLSN